jgi:hypothetical protein
LRISRTIELTGGYPPVFEGSNGGAYRLKHPMASSLARATGAFLGGFSRYFSARLKLFE